MWEIAIKGCVQSIFYTERIVYICKCGAKAIYTGNLQPTLCSVCNRKLPDMQLLRKSRSMRALCHCDFNTYLKERPNHVEKCFDL